MTPPGNATLEATSPAGATQAFVGTAVDDVDGTLSAPCQPTAYPLGPTTVTCTATERRQLRHRNLHRHRPGHHRACAVASRLDRDGGDERRRGGRRLQRLGERPRRRRRRRVVCARIRLDIPDGRHRGQLLRDRQPRERLCGSFSVTVTNAAPTITVPGPQIVEAFDATGANVNFVPAPTASDAQDGPLVPTCSHTSGSHFPLGTTTVGCTAVDGEGASATASFQVVVGTRRRRSSLRRVTSSSSPTRRCPRRTRGSRRFSRTHPQRISSAWSGSSRTRRRSSRSAPPWSRSRRSTPPGTSEPRVRRSTFGRRCPVSPAASAATAVRVASGERRRSSRAPDRRGGAARVARGGECEQVRRHEVRPCRRDHAPVRRARDHVRRPRARQRRGVPVRGGQLQHRRPSVGRRRDRRRPVRPVLGSPKHGASPSRPPLLTWRGVQARPTTTCSSSASRRTAPEPRC